jgi:hypothetical protein
MEREKGKERRIYEKIYEIKELNDYITLILNDIYRLLKDLGKDDDEIANMLHRNSIKAAGQVSKKDVINVINYGNIREKTTAISMFINNCDIIINLICMRDVKDRFPYISIKRLKDIKNKLKKLIGTKDDAVLFDIIKPTATTTATATAATATATKELATSKEAGSLCNVATAPESGVLLLSRVVGFPFGGAENLRRRRPRGEEQDNLKVKISDIKPELSIREKEFMKIKDDDTHVEWETGQMSWIINTKHFLVPIAKKYGNNLISGPAGSIDMIIQTCLLFNNYDLELSTLAGIAWCTMCPDHSAYECLISAMPYGLNYSLNLEAEAYIDDLIRKYKKGTPRGSPKITTGTLAGGKKTRKTQGKLDI